MSAERFRSGTALLLVLTLALGAACRRGEQPDAYGNFETTEVVVSAETAGQLLWFTPDDGQTLDSGTVVGVVDTLQLALQRDQMVALRGASSSRAAEAGTNISVLQAQHEIAERGYDRTQRLHQQQAATTQQLDQAERCLLYTSDAADEL